MPSKKLVYRVGDIIRVTNPEFVTRVGYDLTFDDACELVSTRDKEKIEKAILVLLGKEEEDFFLKLKWEHSSSKNWKFYDNIVRALAYEEVARAIKTGNERKVHTELIETYRDKEFKVMGKRCVKSGLYDPPYSCQDYFGEWDCYSGGLAKEKTHVLLEVYPLREGFVYAHGDKLEIEITNVEKVETK